MHLSCLKKDIFHIYGLNMNIRKENQAYMFASLTILFWSTVATAFKIALNYLDYIELLLFASLTSVVILGIILVSQGRLQLIFHQKVKQYLFSALLGFLNPFLYYLVLFKAYTLLPAQVAQPLNMIWPIVLVFLAIPFLKQKPGIKSFVALFISFGGVFLISSQGNLSGYHIDEPLGVALAAGSSIIWSFFWILNVRDKRDEVVKLFLNFLFAMIFILLLYVLRGNYRTIPVKGFTAALYVGAFEMGFSFVFWLKALQLARSTDVISNMVYLSPFISLIFIHFILGEQIYITTIAGLVLIVFGIILQKLRLTGVIKKPGEKPSEILK